MRYGTAPRELSFLSRLLFPRVQRPAWLRSSDGLCQLFRHQEKLIAHGIVHLGALVQANEALFNPGPHDLPGELLICLNENLDPDFVSQIAYAVYGLKGQPRPDPDGARLSHYLADELIRVYGYPVPPDITGGLTAHCSTTVFRRRSLPDGYLSGRLFPILVHPETFHATVLPHRYWSPEAREVYETTGHIR